MNIYKLYKKNYIYKLHKHRYFLNYKKVNYQGSRSPPPTFCGPCEKLIQN